MTLLPLTWFPSGSCGEGHQPPLCIAVGRQGLLASLQLCALLHISGSLPLIIVTPQQQEQEVTHTETQTHTQTCTHTLTARGVCGHVFVRVREGWRAMG